MKKTLLLLGALFLLPLHSHAFNDVDESHIHAEAITFIESEGIIEGYNDGNFFPDAPINRVEFLKILLLSTDLTQRPCTKRLFHYSDTTQDAWYYQYLQTAGNCGIATGYEDSTFRPEAALNYAEASKMILEAKDLTNCKALTYTTYASDAPWYTPYMICLEQYSNTTHNPAATLTRGGMAQLIFDIHHAQQPEKEIITMEVGAHKETCTGVGPMECLVVNGAYFYDTIKGFTFEEGYTYTLTVEKTTKVTPLPADASSYTYTLREVVAKTPISSVFIGMKEEDAQALAATHDIAFRVVQRDNEHLAVTMDYRPGRINAVVEDAVVTTVSIEGEETTTPSENYIGLTELQATSLANRKGREFRVVERDGEALMVTMDYRPGRVNATIEEGVVTSYTIEEEDLEQSYVGLSEEEAMALAVEQGTILRVVERDGEVLPATMDYRPGRINATVENGIVTSFTVE